MVFALDATVATILSQIACSENELPQGSPCSPVISNLIGHMLDVRLARFAKSNKCTYSRYADDITFSTNQREFPSELATPDAAEPFKWRLGDPLASKIENSGFRVNHSKTRMQFRGSRQVITGLLVNEKVNIRPEYYRTVRSMCHELFNRGKFYRMMPAGLMGGLPTDAAVKVSTTRTDQLNGMLAHVHYVKGYAARQQDTKNKNQEKDPAAATLYEKFLFYKNFVALSAPLVIPEGKTDPIYVRMAIAKLGAYHGRLAQILDGKLSPTLRFLRATRTVHELLKVGNGTGGMPMFISTYKDRLKRYRHKPLLHPVILLIDNDDGASKVFGPARSASGAKIDHTTKDPFYYLWANLYLVKTPELGAKGTSRMEDFFDKAVLATAVDGKTFDPDKDHDEPGKYGKVVFAEKVVKPNADTIDFSKFAPLLERIVAVLDDYDKRKAIPLTI